MLLQLDPITINLDDDLEKSFVTWYHDHKHLSKDVILQGFAAVKLGVAKLFENSDNVWKQRFEQLQDKLDVSMTDAINTSTASLQAQLANKNKELAALRSSYESQLNALKTSMDALKTQQDEQLCAIKSSHDCLVTSLKQQLDDARSKQQDGVASIKASYDSVIASLEKQLELGRAQHADELAAVKAVTLKELEWKTQAALKELELKNRELDMAKAEALKELELKNRELADAEVKMGLLVDKAKAEAMAEMAGKQVEANKFELLYLEAEKKLQAALEGTLLRSQECVIDGLQRDLKNKEEELACLKRTNFGRGVVGETMIVDFLRRTYCDACVEDKSHCKHSCDVWMTLSNGDYFAFESKFKDTINSKGDIDKFYNDVASMSRDARFLGAVFVSCKTCNIPGKGALCVEVFNDRPLLFVGFDGEDGFDGGWLKQCLVILFQLAQHQKNVVGKSTSIQDVVKKLVPLLDKIKKIRGSIEKIRKVHLTQVMSLTDDMDKDLACMFEEIVGVTGNQSDGMVMFHCEKCNQAFKTKLALGKHVKGCNASL